MRQEGRTLSAGPAASGQEHAEIVGRSVAGDARRADPGSLIMQSYDYRHGQLVVEDVPVAKIAERVGTPFYVYSRAHIEARWRAFDQAFAGRNHLVCYAVKANSNLAVLQLLARLGSGFDIVSIGELERVLVAGG